jgi:hypothetical protein
MKARAALPTIAFFILAALAFQESSDELVKLASAAPSAERYPNTDALVLKSDTRVQIEAAGIVRTRVHDFTKIFTEPGRQRLTTIRIPFCSSNSAVKLLRARTLLSDGSIYSLAEDAFETAPAYGAENSYQDMLEAVVAIGGAQAANVIETLIAVNSKEVDPKRVDGAVYFRGKDPCREQVLTVRVPAGIELHYAYSSDVGKPIIRNVETSKTYTWRALNRPPMGGEPLGPDAGMAGSRLLFSTYPTWGDVYRHLAENFFKDLKLSGKAAEAAEKLTENLGQARGPAPTDKGAEAAEKLIEGKPNLAEVASRLEEQMGEAIKRVPLPLALMDYRARPAQEVFESGFGYDFEIAVVAVALLRKAGIQAFPVMISASRDFVRTVPAPIQFDRIAVVIGSGEEQVWFYPDRGLSQSLGLPPWNRTVLWLLDETYKLETVDEQTAVKNSAQARVEMRMAPDGITHGSTYSACSGIFNPNFMLREGTQSLDELADEKMRWPGREIKIDKALILRRLASTCHYELSWTAEGAVRKSGDMLFIRIPPSFFSSPVELLPLFQEIRRTPVVFPSPWEEQEQISLAIPEGMEPFLQPVNLSIENNVGKVEIRSTYMPEERELSVERYLRVDHSSVDASAYPALRDLLRAWRSPASTTIVLAPEEK